MEFQVYITYLCSTNDKTIMYELHMATFHFVTEGLYIKQERGKAFCHQLYLYKR